MTMITHERSAVPVANRLRWIIKCLPATGGDQDEIERLFRCLTLYKWVIRAGGTVAVLSIMHACVQLFAVV